MSGHKKAGSWQEGVARSFSRLFSRNQSQDKEVFDSAEKSNSSKETNQEIQGEDLPSSETSDRQEFEASSLKSEDNTSQLLVGSVVVAEGDIKNSSSVKEDGNVSENEASSLDERNSATTYIKASDHDRQSKDNFLLFLGNLFNFTPKSASADSKQTTSKEESLEDGKGQSSLCEEGSLNQEAPIHLNSEPVLMPKEEAAAASNEDDKDKTPPTSPTESENGKKQEITEAPKVFQLKADAPAVTYATYRGSRQIRKLLKRRASVDSTIPEREDHIESQNTFTVTESGEILKIVSTVSKDEGQLPNGISIDGNQSKEAVLQSKFLSKNIVDPISNDKSNSAPNLAKKRNSLSYHEQGSDMAPVSGAVASLQSGDDSKLCILPHGGILNKGDKEASSRCEAAVLSKSDSSINTSDTISESSVANIPPMSGIVTLEKGMNSEGHISKNIAKSITQQDLEMPSNAKKHFCDEGLLSDISHSKSTDVEIRNKDESSLLTNGTLENSEGAREHTSFKHDHLSKEFRNSSVCLQEPKDKNAYHFTSTNKCLQLAILLPIFEETPHCLTHSPQSAIENPLTSQTFHESEDVLEANTLALICTVENAVATDESVPVSDLGYINSVKTLPEGGFVTMIHGSSQTQELSDIGQDKLSSSTSATMIQPFNVLEKSIFPPPFVDDDDADKNKVNCILCDASTVLKASMLQIETDTSKCSLKIDDCDEGRIECATIASPDGSTASTDNIELRSATLSTLNSTVAGITASGLVFDQASVPNTFPTLFARKGDIYPPVMVSRDTMPNFPESTKESVNAIWSEITPSVESNNNSSSDILVAVSTNAYNILGKIEPSTLESISTSTESQCFLPLPNLPSAVKRDSSNVDLCWSTRGENRKLANGSMEDFKISYGQDQKTPDSGNIVVAKISMKSVNINEVEISPPVFQSEVVKLSTHSSKAFEPEYICLPNGTSSPLLEPPDTGQELVSAPAFKKCNIATVDVYSLTIENGDEQLCTVHPGSFECESNSTVITFKEVDTSVLGKSVSIEDTIESIDGTDLSTKKSEKGHAAFPPALKYEGSQANTNYIVIGGGNGMSNNVVLENEKLLVLGTETIEGTAIAKDLLPFEIEDGRLIKQCRPAVKSMDICIPIVSSCSLPSEDSMVSEVLPLCVPSELTNNGNYNNVPNNIQTKHELIGESGVATVLDCEINPGFATSKPKLSYLCSEEFSLQGKEEDNIDTLSDVHVDTQDLNPEMLNKAETIASDVLRLSLDEMKSTQKMLNHVCGNELKITNNNKIHEIKRARSEEDMDEAFRMHIEHLNDKNSAHVLPLTEKESSNHIACNATELIDGSLRADGLYTQDLLALKAEQIINEVMSFVKQKMSSGELEHCLDKNHNETIVNTANSVFTENITFPNATTLTACETSWHSPICASIPLHYSPKDSNCTDCSLATFEYSVDISKDKKMVNSMETAENESSSGENELFSFDDSLSVESDAEPIGDGANRNVVKEEIAEGKLNLSSTSMDCCEHKVLKTINQNERVNLSNYGEQRLNSEELPENITKNYILQKEHKNVSYLSGTERNCDNLSNPLHHQISKQMCSLPEDGSEEEGLFIPEEGNKIYTPYSPDLGKHFVQHVPRCEESNDAASYYYEGTNLINVTRDSSGTDLSETVQAKPFRVFPFALSPIYEDDSSQEELLSSDISPGYSNKGSPKDSSSVLSLLQSVSERLKCNNRLDKEEEDMYLEDSSEAQDEDSTYPLEEVHIVDGLDSSLSSTIHLRSKGPALYSTLQTEKLLKETLPSLLPEDHSYLLPRVDTGTSLKSATRSVYYQYLQTAKDYSCEKGTRMGSILHDILMPKHPQLKVDDSTKTEIPLVNPIDMEALKYNPRPGKMIIYDVLGTGNKIEVCNDVLDATHWTFPSKACIRVVRGCWVLYEKPLFQGQVHVLEEGESVLNNVWDQNNAELTPQNTTIGSIQRLVKGGSVPEVEICTESDATVPISLQSEVSSLLEHTVLIPTAITVKSGVWLAYSDIHYRGKMTILEPGRPQVQAIPGDMKSLRPLQMGGLKVQMPIDPKIIIYEKPNFNGWAKPLSEHVYSVKTLFSRDWDFKGIGSIRVCGGVWVAYEQEKYKGRQYLLEEGEYADCQAWGGVRSNVLSFRYLQADFLESSVTLYESDAEDGKLIDILNQEIPDLEKVGFCSETRSIHVQRGMWVAYRQKHYCGDQYILEKGKYKSFSDWGGNNGTILSIRPVLLEPLGRDKTQHLIKAYSDDNFHGHCAEYTAEVSDLTSNIPCSFKVLHGCWLLGYQGDDADEECLLEEGHYPDLASCGCPTTCIKSLKPIDYVFAEPTISLFALDSCEGRELYFEEAVNSVLSKDLHFYTQSVWVRSGLWIAYEGANFLGKQILLETGEIINWTDFSGWNAIGSLRPVKQPAVYVKIKNRAQDKYLTVTGKLTDAKATSVCIAPCNGKNSQVWYYCRGLFKSKVNHACLDVIGGRDVPGSKVALWTEHGKSRQKWRVNKDGTITSYISDELVLDVKGGNYYDKHSIVINNPMENEFTQKWEMEIL
ncbi:very large A-kinase anchor protein isoform X2 [Ambystoma mexicanum]|uniref:very large A-kinase anchor protein isoform X2 n=1 Tax=Ambystoma mexicanum TaxID=8296 RepID=UPI0037E7E32F